MSVATTPKTDTVRAERERRLDRLARREAVRRNARKGVGRNLEEGIALVRAGREFGAAFQQRR